MLQNGQNMRKYRKKDFNFLDSLSNILKKNKKWLKRQGKQVISISDKSINK